MSDQPQASAFRSVAIGVVAENKELLSPLVKVTDIEDHPYLDGGMAPVPVTMEYSVTTDTGVNSAGSVFIDQVIEAKWLPEGNRVTAPDVRVGEKVELYQMADADQYYWRCLNLQKGLRKLETVVWAINANPTESTGPDDPNDAINIDNCYILEVSSHSKTAMFRTSNKNGEFCQYLAQFDMGKGNVVLEDDIGNHFILDSAKTLIEMKNADLTRITMNGIDLDINVPGDLTAFIGQSATARIGQNLSINVGLQTTVDSGSGITLKTGGNVLEMTPGGTVWKTPTFDGIS